jgi:hypothetical protein
MLPALLTLRKKEANDVADALTVLEKEDKLRIVDLLKVGLNYRKLVHPENGSIHPTWSSSAYAPKHNFVLPT